MFFTCQRFSRQILFIYQLLLCLPISMRRAELFTKSNERLRRDGQARCPEGDTKRELRCGQHTKSATIAPVTFSWPLCMDLLSPVLSSVLFSFILSCLICLCAVSCFVSVAQQCVPKRARFVCVLKRVLKLHCLLFGAL